jgi:hypothetical protein
VAGPTGSRTISRGPNRRRAAGGGMQVRTTGPGRRAVRALQDFMGYSMRPGTLSSVRGVAGRLSRRFCKDNHRRQTQAHQVPVLSICNSRSGPPQSAAPTRRLPDIVGDKATPQARLEHPSLKCKPHFPVMCSTALAGHHTPLPQLSCLGGDVSLPQDTRLRKALSG